GCFFFLAEARYKLNGALDPILQRTQRILFLLDGAHTLAHSFSKAARADSLTASADLASSARLRNADSSFSAISARTLRFKSIPAALSPCMNLLYEMSAARHAALIRTIHRAR